MVRRSRRGASLLAVLGLVSVLSFLAAAMSAMFLVNLNFTQGSFNGDIALSQAEAGLNEVLYKLGNDEDYTFGQGQEEVAGSMTTDLRRDQSFYRVTFKPGTGYPHSTNNIKGDHPTGYLSRPVGEGYIHVISTGFCRGQYRSIEAVLRQPDAPFGLASSAKIHSKYPLQIFGTSSTSNAEVGKYDRPGHLVCNSANGIEVEKGSAPNDVTTHVSGFVKSVGPIKLDPGAQVDAGVRPNSSSEALPKFEIRKDFDPKGKPGTIEIVELQHDGQELDCIYRSSHDLTFNGPVKMFDSYLYVQGNLTILGGLRGVGAIVVDGDVTVRGDVELDGANNLALLATGKVTLRGAGNYFQGYVYGEGGVDAENITVVGSLICHHDPSQPEPVMELDRVTVVNDESQGVLTFTAQSYTTAVSQTATGNANWLSFDWAKWGAFEATTLPPPGSTPPAKPPEGEGALYENNIATDLPYILKLNAGKNPGEQVLKAKSPDEFLKLPPGTQENPSLDDLRKAYAKVIALKKEANEYLSLGTPENPPPDLPGNPLLNPPQVNPRARWQELHGQLAGAWNSYTSAADTWAEAYNNWVKAHSSGNGSRRLRYGAGPPDVSREYVFDLNKYLPMSDRLQVTYWQVYGRRL